MFRLATNYLISNAIQVCGIYSYSIYVTYLSSCVKFSMLGFRVVIEYTVVQPENDLFELQNPKKFLFPVNGTEHL